MKPFLIVFLGLALSVNVKAQSNSSQLLGKWMLEELSIGDTTVTADACMSKSYLIFKSDNTTVSQWFYLNSDNNCEAAKIATQSFSIVSDSVIKNDKATMSFEFTDKNTLVLRPVEIKHNDDSAIHILFKSMVYSRSNE